MTFARLEKRELSLNGIDGEDVTITINPDPQDAPGAMDSCLDIEIFAQDSLTARMDGHDLDRLIQFLMRWRLNMPEAD